jgi:hypothetical protein
MIKIYWYLFTHQFETVLNYFYYPYLFSGTFTYCENGICTSEKILPYYLAVLITDGFLILVIFKILFSNKDIFPHSLDSPFL